MLDMARRQYKHLLARLPRQFGRKAELFPERGGPAIGRARAVPSDRAVDTDPANELELLLH